jgi:UDP-glucose 4-epimerase
MKVLVTGGAGFIGSNIVEELVNSGHETVAFDNFFLGRKENLSSVNVKIINGDIRDRATLDKAAEGCDFIFNEAAASSSPMFKENLREAVSVNVDGFVNVLDVARKHDCGVIYASTSSIYGNISGALREDMNVVPPNFYAATKLLNEHLAAVYSNEYGIRAIGFRYMSIYGRHEESKGIFANLVSQFLWEMKKDEQPVIYGDGEQTRDFVLAKDVAAAHLLAMKSGVKSDVFNIGTGKATSLNELVDIINKILGKTIKPNYVKVPVKNYIATQQADTSKTEKLIGFKAKYSLEQGIRQII